ncbi:nuclear transport factor 2 family protein [Kitasatospora sp. NPDC127116]|uniref:nuclear transport factor 2 family protein n=1 Tax=Kitasatospora sp. NPDC127116 TaxID=3345367 RepID=UPI003630AE54
MTTVEALSDPVVRQFIETFNQRDSDAWHAALAEDVVLVSDGHDVDIADLWESIRYFTIGSEADGGASVTGVSHRQIDHTDLNDLDGVTWKFTVTGDKISRFEITDAQVPPELLEQASEEVSQMKREEWARSTCTASDGSKHPLGTLRRFPSGIERVQQCAVGGSSSVGWMETGIKIDPDKPFRTYRDPATGVKTFMGEKDGVSKVEAVLTAELGWDVELQKVTVIYEAVPRLRDAGIWYGENNELVPKFVPKMDITLTLTGPDGATISSEDITVVGEKVPYRLKAERVFHNLALGTHKVAVKGVKTGGRRTTDGRNYTGNDKVVLGEQSVEFTIGG